MPGIFSANIYFGNVVGGTRSASYTVERSGNRVEYNISCKYYIKPDFDPQYFAPSYALSATIADTTLTGSVARPGAGATSTKNLGPFYYYMGEAEDTEIPGVLEFSGSHTFDADVPAGGGYTVTFNFNGSGQASETKTVYYGKAYGALPTATRTGYAFSGWFTDPVNGTQITAESIVDLTADTTLYAHWEAMSILHLVENGTLTTVTDIRVAESGEVRRVLSVWSVENGVPRQGI